MKAARGGRRGGGRRTSGGGGGGGGGGGDGGGSSGYSSVPNWAWVVIYIAGGIFLLSLFFCLFKYCC